MARPPGDAVDDGDEDEELDWVGAEQAECHAADRADGAQAVEQGRVAQRV